MSIYTRYTYTEEESIFVQCFYIIQCTNIWSRESENIMRFRSILYLDLPVLFFSCKFKIDFIYIRKGSFFSYPVVSVVDPQL